MVGDSVDIYVMICFHHLSYGMKFLEDEAVLEN